MVNGGGFEETPVISVISDFLYNFFESRDLGCLCVQNKVLVVVLRRLMFLLCKISVKDERYKNLYIHLGCKRGYRIS